VFCSTCNARLLEGATFCNQCGAPVTAPPRAEPANADALQVERLGDPPPPLEAMPAPRPVVPAATPSFGPASTPALGTPLPPLPPGPIFAPPAYRPPAPAAAVRYGGFWRRLWGSLVDSAWCYLIATLTMMALRMDVSFDPSDMNLFGDVDWGQMAVNQTVAWLYAALFMCSPAQGTLGQLLFNLKVTDVAGRRISFLRATGRYFAQFISTLVLFIGYLMIAFHPQKRGLHDLIAGTLVVHRERGLGDAPSR
jgi:uncharacterized RDD family membrane protein YckC